MCSPPAILLGGFCHFSIMLHYANSALKNTNQLIIAHSGRGFPHTFVRFYGVLSLVPCRGFATHTPLRDIAKNSSPFFQGGDARRAEGVNKRKQMINIECCIFQITEIIFTNGQMLKANDSLNRHSTY